VIEKPDYFFILPLYLTNPGCFESKAAGPGRGVMLPHCLVGVRQSCIELPVMEQAIDARVFCLSARFRVLSASG